MNKGNELVALDIGGTYARFALAHVAPGGAIALGEPVTLRTGDFPGLAEAWAEFSRLLEHPPPRDAAIAIAAPVTGDVVPMTNGHWVMRQSSLATEPGLDRVTVLNDFAAIAHAATTLGDAAFEPLCGPDLPLPESGTVTVLGPGTGLGVALVHRFPGGYRVQATEGGHIAFGPLDDVDDLLARRLRARHGRVSVERVVSGPGLAEIHAALAEREGRAVPGTTDAVLWQAGIEGSDPLAASAVGRFCQSLGSVAGDYALAHGAGAVVIAGGLARRLREKLRGPAFAASFRAKGRYEAMMAGIPVRLLTHPQPGLFGAAAAFAREHCP
ncbi:MAG: glucokinase [Novosphingobium sp.]|nr:glucokinase [Novosphingobium sp.]